METIFFLNTSLAKNKESLTSKFVHLVMHSWLWQPLNQINKPALNSIWPLSSFASVVAVAELWTNLEAADATF